MTYVKPGDPSNYTIGGMRFYFASDLETVGADVAITDADTVAKTFTIAGAHAADYPAGSGIRVSGSTDNDGDYVVTSAAEVLTDTVITVDKAPHSNTADGDLALFRDGYLYLGNVVTGDTGSDITFLDHFTAKTGTRTKDRSVVQEISSTIALTLDEPNADNMNFFMLGGAMTTVAGPPGYKKFAPFTRLERNGGAKLGMVSDTGNEAIWFLRKSVLKPEGRFSFNDQDWSQFQFTLEALKDTANPAEPFGYQYHYGVGENIEQDTTLLPDNA